MLIENGVLRGAAIFDLTRIAARQKYGDLPIAIDFFPQESLTQLERRLQTLLARTGSLRTALNALGLPPMLADALAEEKVATAVQLKEYRPGTLPTRSLKEAIVTVGGLSCNSFDPNTMQCFSLPGLYAAGEVLDIDGPTGGYNLHAAFATARLAVNHLTTATRNDSFHSSRPYGPKGPAKGSRDPRKSAWGKHFWDGQRPGR